MQLRLEDVDFSDGSELATVQTRSQAEDELNQALHPGLTFDAALAETKAQWPSVYGFGCWHYKKVVDVETRKIVSFSRWATDEEYRRHLPPLTGVPEGLEIPPRKKPESLDLQLLARLEEQTVAVAERHICDRPSLYLGTMCTLPEYRGRGAAGLMLKWATNFADKHGLVCYSEAPISCVSIHFKNGFEEMDTIDMAIGNAKAYTLVCLLREPA